jgi:hypothetical protein
LPPRRPCNTWMRRSPSHRRQHTEGAAHPVPGPTIQNGQLNNQFLPARRFNTRRVKISPMSVRCNGG